MKKIIVIILVLLFVVLPGTLIFLLYPGSAFDTLSSEASPVPGELEADLKSIRLHEEWIRNRLLSALKENLPQEGLSFQGLSFTSTRGGISVGVGVRLDAPLIGSFPLLLRLRMPIGYDEQLRLGVEDVRIGRLPVPSFLLRRALKRIDKEVDLNALSFPLAHRVDVEGLSLFLDIDPFLDSLFPGARAVNVSAVDNYLVMGIELPNDISAAIESLAADFASHGEGLSQAIAAALPQEKREAAAGIEEMLTAAATFSSSSAAVSGDTRQEGALVSYCEGDVEAGMAEDDFHWVEFGETIPVGATLRTGKNSYVELLLPGDNILKVDASTVLVLEHSQADGEVHQNRVRQLSGALRSRVSKLKGDKSWYEITVKSAVMGVRGTDFCTFADKRDEFRIAVLTGEVLVDADESEPVAVEPEESLTVAEGKSGMKEAIDEKSRKKIEKDLEIRTTDEDIRYLTRGQLISFIMPQVLQYAELWEGLSKDEKWEIQYAFEDYMESNPQLARRVDTFFKENNLEEKRQEIEKMFR
jgi:uncharacterized cupin superfamily protein